MTRPRCITCGNAYPCACRDYAGDIERLKSESKSLIEQARRKRDREAWKRPILDAFDRLTTERKS